eukprot:6173511-Pleurochrysis_carterae.AAC.5
MRRRRDARIVKKTSRPADTNNALYHACTRRCASCAEGHAKLYEAKTVSSYFVTASAILPAAIQSWPIGERVPCGRLKVWSSSRRFGGAHHNSRLFKWRRAGIYL